MCRGRREKSVSTTAISVARATRFAVASSLCSTSTCFSTHPRCGSSWLVNPHPTCWLHRLSTVPISTNRNGRRLIQPSTSGQSRLFGALSESTRKFLVLNTKMERSFAAKKRRLSSTLEADCEENSVAATPDRDSSSEDSRTRAGSTWTLLNLVNHLQESEDPLWELLLFEGREASKQSHMSSMIHGSILAKTSLEDAMSSNVANKMAATFLSATELSALFRDMFSDTPSFASVVAEDLLTHVMRDASVPDVLTALLFHKGFTALAVYRLMHWLWLKDRRLLARYLQSVCSEICAADIHPASTIGKGIFVAGGCDIVIGETAVVGDDVCLLQGVTLGGTGRQSGDRHPKVANGCHIGAGSSVLGNIPIGEGSRIEASSVVVKPIAPYSVNRGVPTKPVAYITCDPYQDVRGGCVLRAQGDDSSSGSRDGDECDESGPRLMFTNFCSLYIGI